MNLGLGHPVQPPPLPAGSPAKLSELRAMIATVDNRLRFINSRPARDSFSRQEVIDMLLDVRSLLDRISAPITLITMAQEISQENKLLRESLGE